MLGAEIICYALNQKDGAVNSDCQIDEIYRSRALSMSRNYKELGVSYSELGDSS